LVSALALAAAVTLLPPPLLLVPLASSPPNTRASTVPSTTTSATTTAMITRVRFGTTSVIGALGTGLGGRSGGVITGHPELRPPVAALPAGEALASCACSRSPDTRPGADAPALAA
jgi:hypothetical protein